MVGQQQRQQENQQRAERLAAELEGNPAWLVERLSADLPAAVRLGGPSAASPQPPPPAAAAAAEVAVNAGVHLGRGRVVLPAASESREGGADDGAQAGSAAGAFLVSGVHLGRGCVILPAAQPGGGTAAGHSAVGGGDSFTSNGGGGSFTSAGGGGVHVGRGRVVLPDDGEPRLRGQSPERKRAHGPPPPLPLRQRSDASLPRPDGHSDDYDEHMRDGHECRLNASMGAASPPGSSSTAATTAVAGAGRHSHASTDYPSNHSTRGFTASELPTSTPGSPTTAAAAATGPAAAAARAAQRTAIAAATAAAAPQASDPIRLIDYEYAGSSPIAFDIANHWSEWAADYHSDTPSVLDFSRLPQADQQTLFVAAYLRGLLAVLGLAAPEEASALLGSGGGGGGGAAAAASVGELLQQQAAAAAALTVAGGSSKTAAGGSLWSVWDWLRQHGVECGSSGGGGGGGGGAAGAAVSPAAWRSLLHQLLGGARAYECIAHLQWALWGLIQSKDSSVDFDYLGYAQQKWNEYRRHVPGPAGVAALGAVAAEF